MPTYRPLAPEELVTLCPQITDELAALKAWQQFKTYAQGVFGPTAYKVEVETEGEYDDEGGTDYFIRHVQAYTKEGKRLDFDLTLPFWDTIVAATKYYQDDFAALKQAQIASGKPSDYWEVWENDAMSDMLRDFWGDYLPDGDDVDEEYVFDVPPKLTFPQLYIATEDPLEAVAA